MLKPTLQLKLGQTLTMTPQLQQAIRLLQLPVLDLNAQIPSLALLFVVGLALCWVSRYPASTR